MSYLAIRNVQELHTEPPHAAVTQQHDFPLENQLERD